MLRSAARNVMRRLARPARGVLRRVVEGVAPGVIDRRAQGLEVEARDLAAQINALEEEIARVLKRVGETAEAIAAQAPRE